MRLQLKDLAGAGALLALASATHADSRPTARASAEVSGYSDSDHVQVLSPTVSGTVADETAGWSVGGRYLVDMVSAASVDVVSTASARWNERRHVGSASGELKRDRWGVSLSGGVSSEPDYLSLGGGGTVSIELLDKNLTPFIGGSYGHDSVGRTGEPRDQWQGLRRFGAQAGATFVVDRATIANVTADAIFERGYLAKPYRYVPVFAPGASADVPAGASVDQVNRERLPLRPADQLPRARDRYAVTGRVAHRFATSTLRLDERLYGDGWGLRATSTEARWLVDLGRRFVLWPQARFHLQNAVDFWQRAYEAAEQSDGSFAVPRFRTGDRELGALRTVTLGAGVRARLTGAGRPPWLLSFQAQTMLTHYDDALYITDRRAVFGALSLEGTLGP